MDAFSRNAMMLLFGSMMLLGIGLVGVLAPVDTLTPGLQSFFSGHAPIVLATMGMLGIAAVVTVLIKGPPLEKRTKNEHDADEEAQSPKATDDTGQNPDQESEGIISDQTLALIESEVLLRQEEGTSCPLLGPEVPPAALCRALLEHESRWICARAKKEMHGALSNGQERWKEATKTITGGVRVRGRHDGEAASYRLAILAHIPPNSSPEQTSDTLELLGKLPGDRFLEVAMVRVPEEADTFASPMNVAGPMATEILLEKAPDGQEPGSGDKA